MTMLRAIRRELADLWRTSPLGELILCPPCDCEHCTPTHKEDHA